MTDPEPASADADALVSRAEPDATPSPSLRIPATAILSFLLTIAFLIPCYLLLPTAAKPGARASYAARHGNFQLDNEEGALLYQATQIRNSESIYHNLEHPPYIAGTYTPLYMATVAAADSLTPPTFATGRFITWAAALISATLLILVTATLTRNAPLGMLSGLMLLATYEVYRWIAYFRVDFLALMLTLFGLATITLGYRRRTALALPLAAMFMTAALYTKQTMIAAPAAALLALLLTRPRHALHFLLYMLAWGIIPLALLQFATDGQFLRHIILYNMNTFSRADLLIWVNHAWNIHRWLLLGAFASLLWLVWGAIGRYSAKTHDSRPLLHGFWTVIPIYGILAWWNLLGAAKAGSAENYLLEPIAAGSLLLCAGAGAALKLARHGDYPLRARVTGLFISTAVLASTLMHSRFINLPAVQQSLFSPYINPTTTDFRASNEVLSRVRRAKKPFCELAILHLQSGSAPVLQPFIMSELSRQGRWNQAPFLSSLDNRDYDLLVVQQDLTRVQAPIEYTDEMLSAIRRNYKLDDTISSPLWTWYLLIPKTESDKIPANQVAQLHTR